MRFTVTFEDPKRSTWDFYTVDAPSFTIALAKAKRECQRFGLTVKKIDEAASDAKPRTIREALEFDENEWEKADRLRSEDYDALLDIALQTKDRAWFDEIQNRKQRSRGQ